MTEAGGPLAPTRQARFDLYRRHHRRQLRSVDRAAWSVGGFAGAAALVLMLLIDGPPPLVCVVMASVVGAVLFGLTRNDGRERYDRSQTMPFTFGELPSSEHLSLHWMSATDVAEFEAAIDDELCRIMHWGAQDRADLITSAHLPGAVATSLTWVVRDRATGAFVGATSCDVDAVQPGVVSIGLWLVASQRGDGRGVELLQLAVPTVAAVLRAYGDQFGGDATQVTLSTATDNTAMRRAAERSGGVAVGTYVHRFPNGTTADSVRYRFATPRHPESGRSAAAVAPPGAGDGVPRSDPAPTKAPAPTSPMGRPLPRWFLPTFVAFMAFLLGVTLLTRVVRDDAGPKVASSVTTASAGGPLDVDDAFEPTDAEVLERGSFDDAEIRVTGLAEPDGSARVTIDVRAADGAGDVASTTVSAGPSATEIAAEKVSVGQGSYVIGLVPADAREAIYQPDGRAEVALPIIDLTDPAGAPSIGRVVAAGVPDQIGGWTLTVVDESGTESVFRAP